MNNTNFKWIEACKSEDMINSLLKFYNEEYLYDDKYEAQFHAISHILTSVVEEEAPIKISALFRCMEESYHAEFSYNKRKMLALAYHLRHTKADVIKGYREWFNGKGV